MWAAPLVSVSVGRSLSVCGSSRWSPLVDSALSVLWPLYRRWEEREEVRSDGGGGGGYSCGASRCSLIVPSDCAASTGDPPPLHADGAVSSFMGMRWLKAQLVKPLLITRVLLDSLRVAGLNVSGWRGPSESYRVFLTDAAEPRGAAASSDRRVRWPFEAKDGIQCRSRRLFKTNTSVWQRFTSRRRSWWGEREG